MSDVNQLNALIETVGLANEIADELTTWLKGSNNTERYAYTHAKIMKYNELLSVADVIEALLSENDKLNDTLLNIQDDVEDITEILGTDITDKLDGEFAKLKKELVNKINKLKTDYNKLLSDFEIEVDTSKTNIDNDNLKLTEIQNKYSATKYSSDRQLIRLSSYPYFAYNILKSENKDLTFGDTFDGASDKFYNILGNGLPTAEEVTASGENVTFETMNFTLDTLEEFLSKINLRLLYNYNNSNLEITRMEEFKNSIVSKLIFRKINLTWYSNKTFLYIPITKNTMKNLLKIDNKFIFSMFLEHQRITKSLNVKITLMSQLFNKDTRDIKRNIVLKEKEYSWTMDELGWKQISFNFNKEDIESYVNNEEYWDDNTELGWYWIQINFNFELDENDSSATVLINDAKLSFGNVITDWCLNDEEKLKEDNSLVNKYIDDVNKEIQEAEDLNNRIKNTEKLIVSETFEIGLESYEITNDDGNIVTVEGDPASVVAIVHADGSMRIRGKGKTRNLYSSERASQEFLNKYPIYNEIGIGTSTNVNKSIFPDRVREFVTSIKVDEGVIMNSAYAFANFINLEEAYIPKECFNTIDRSSACMGLFFNCPKLKKLGGNNIINDKGQFSNYNEVPDDLFIIPTGCSILDYLFTGCNSLNTNIGIESNNNAENFSSRTIFFKTSIGTNETYIYKANEISEEDINALINVKDDSSNIFLR